MTSVAGEQRAYVRSMTQVVYDDPLSEPVWRAAAEGQVVLHRCDVCGTVQAYPRPFCLSCQSSEMRFVPSEGLGRVYAKTVVHLPTRADGATGHAVLLVELREGIRVLAKANGAASWRTDEAVHVFYETGPDGDPVLTAERVSASLV